MRKQSVDSSASKWKDLKKPTPSNCKEKINRHLLPRANIENEQIRLQDNPRNYIETPFNNKEFCCTATKKTTNELIYDIPPKFSNLLTGLWVKSPQITPKFAKTIPLSAFPFFLFFFFVLFCFCFFHIKFAVEFICLVLSFHSVSELENCGNIPHKREIILLQF